MGSEENVTTVPVVRLHEVNESLEVLSMPHDAAPETDLSHHVDGRGGKCLCHRQPRFLHRRLLSRSSLFRWSSPLASLRRFWAESHDGEACWSHPPAGVMKFCGQVPTGCYWSRPALKATGVLLSVCSRRRKSPAVWQDSAAAQRQQALKQPGTSTRSADNMGAQPDSPRILKGNRHGTE